MIEHRAFANATSPAWSEATEGGSVGRDFLGTLAVNLGMLGRLTGALNNVVKSSRQHAIVAWGAWRYLENCRSNKTDASPKQFRNFIDAIETIQLIGERARAKKEGRTPSGLGVRSIDAIGDRAVVPLRFEAYGRSQDTSALAPVQYGPSAKPGSLGFLDARTGVWVPTKRGRLLAAALDAELRLSPAYLELAAHPIPETMSLASAEDLALHGLTLAPDTGSRGERAPYIEALFELDNDHASTQHERSLSVALIIHVVEQLQGAKGMTDQQLREHLLACSALDGSDLKVPLYLGATLRRWQLFQLRQLQRFVLESWLFVAEWLMPSPPERALQVLGEHVEGLGAPNEDLASLLKMPVAVGVKAFLEARKIQDVVKASLQPEHSPWLLVARVRELFQAKTPALGLSALMVLTLSTLALFNVLVPEDPDAPSY